MLKFLCACIILAYAIEIHCDRTYEHCVQHGGSKEWLHASPLETKFNECLDRVHVYWDQLSVGMIFIDVIVLFRHGCLFLFAIKLNYLFDGSNNM